MLLQRLPVARHSGHFGMPRPKGFGGVQAEVFASLGTSVERIPNWKSKYVCSGIVLSYVLVYSYSCCRRWQYARTSRGTQQL